ncbi:MAG: baseplate J/gp47 family protein [Arcobacter sp.]|uniref:baseplate J/gp47 family protein n=1 Tax=Arcobacter sp. TaxID=1872629 RepID=UPI003D01409B
MINVKALPTPTVLNTKTYEEILASNIDILKGIFTTHGIDWQPLDSDQYSLVVQAFSYRELYLRNEINEIVKQLLLAFCSGANLDHKVAENGIERLAGSNPYAVYEFSISAVLTNDYTIQAGLVLKDETNSSEAILLNDITIKAGTLKTQGVIELQEKISESSVKTENITTSLPYVITAKALEAFKNGAETETDESLLNRYLISFADKSTAGAEETYKSLVLKSDRRIEDVKIIGNEDAIVKIYYFSEKADELMSQRIIEACNDKQERPLTDKVEVFEATKVLFNIDANLKIYKNQESAALQIAALNSLKTGLKEITKIGEVITLSEINDFLKVEGIKEVVVNSPVSNVEVLENEIGICNDISITITTI